MILVLRALGIGDLATAVPALRGLRRAFPGQLVLAAPAWLGPVVDLVGGIDALVPCDGLAPRTLPKASWAVNLHGKGPQSHRLLDGSRPERLAAFACPDAEHVDGPQWTDDEHEVRRWCRLLDWYGVSVDPTDLALRRPASSPRPGVAVVHPGAKAAERRWPPRRFAVVARDLVARGYDVVVTGTRAERPIGERVAALAGLPADTVLAGRTDTGALAAIVARARLVVSGDTGIAHLATAYGTPSVVLFGPVTPRAWGPPPDRGQHRALWRGPAVASIAVADVLTAVDEATCAAPA